MFHPVCKSKQELFFASSPSSPRTRNAKEYVWGGSCQLDILPLENLLEVSLSPLAWTCDAVYKNVESSLAIFPSWLSSHEDCKCVYVSENIESWKMCYSCCPKFESVLGSKTHVEQMSKLTFKNCGTISESRFYLRYKSDFLSES